MNLALSRKKVYRTFLMSYLLILLIPMLVLIYSSNHSLTLVNQQLEKDNRLMLEQFYSGIDTLLITSQKMGDQLAFDTATGYFLEREDLSTQLNSPYAYQNIKHLKSELSNINSINSQIQNSYIYYTGLNRIISCDGITDGRFFFSQRLSMQYDNYEEWIKYLSEIDDAGFMYNPANTHDKSSVKSISYARRIQWVEKQPPAYIVITLNSDFLEKQISLIDNQKNVIAFVLDSKLQPIYSSNSSLAPSFEKLTGESYGWYIDKINGNSYRLSWIRSAKTGCIYILAIPQVTFISPVVSAKILSLIIFFFVLVMGIFLAILLARKSYNPIKGLTDFIGASTSFEIPYSSNGDDFNYLHEVLEKLADDKNKIEMELSSHRSAVKNSIIERLLYSNFPCKLPPEERLEALNLHFDSTDFAVVILKLEHPENSKENIAEIRSRLYSGELWEKILGRWYNTYNTQINGDTVLLINFRGGVYDEQKKSIKESMILCHKMIFDSFGILMSLYISDIQHTFAGIHKAFRETLSLSEYINRPGETIFAWEMLSTNSFDLYYSYKPETEQKLINLMAAGEIDQAKVLISKVHEENIKKMPLWFEKVIILDLLSSCMKAMNLVKTETQDYSGLENRMRELLHDDPENYNMSQVLDILELVCTLARSKTDTCKSVSIDEKVMSIIKKEYSNPDLSVAYIAECLNINPSYATALYKKRTGNSITDSITGYRLSKAAELLTSTSKDIKDIAASTGFYNSAGFIRTFKKCKGLTPGQFRTMNCGNGSAFTDTISEPIIIK